MIFLRKSKLAAPVFILFLLVLFSAIWIPRLRYASQAGRLTEEILFSADFRSQPVNDEMMSLVKEWDSARRGCRIILAGKRFSAGKDLSLHRESDREKGEMGSTSGLEHLSLSLPGRFGTMSYIFQWPVPPTGQTYQLPLRIPWLFGRSYGGERGHEGTDIMATVNERGMYPVISMTDGIVESKGWLELGGYRLGIRAPQGAYFYYGPPGFLCGY